MTPLPRPIPRGTHRMRADNPIPMTPGQYLRWTRPRRRSDPVTLLTPTETKAALEKLQGYPYWRDVVEAAADGQVDDEVDGAYLAAIRLAPAVVGTQPGQVPMEVARRLYEAGLVRKQK